MNSVNMTDRDVRHIERRSAARAIVVVLLAAGIVTFAVVNRHEVAVDYVADEVDVALWLVIAIAAALGILIGTLLSWRRAK